MAKRPEKRKSKERRERPVAAPASTHETISIRKIANGYIVRRSSYGGKGMPVESEHYTADKPEIDLPKPSKVKKDAE